ncbi:hypothetical protein GCM10011375_30690 [Hymenobacter qilianensis]|uniref:Uncharacterized protein n=2 Tax=Hymenobacter qilianensis TaxID=1385715 RepID=A0ACB5PUP7_9BACT|nr:DUF2892 domain-containing protein [Hymenobacter qilianensis]QNP51621.1 DUF2892 domain-containing protein [Hymenobacter qilianensis]GGF73459.1 hypothetical protein GCM10011375_30690 [Hymenobacter qilianensis]
MRQNLSSYDRVIRILLATFLTGFLVRQGFSTPVLLAWLLVPLTLLLTGIAGYCPFYSLLGIATHHQSRS